MNKITRTILEDLETVRESLLSLSDDIWLSIDHNDNKQLKSLYEFKLLYNSKLLAFDSLSSEISQLVQQFTKVNLQSNEGDGSVGDSENERLVRELQKDEPHSLREDFTFKRPHGFILRGTAITGFRTWKRLYTRFCETLHRLDPQTFRDLPENEDFISSHGNHAFSQSKEFFRAPVRVGGLYTEAGLSAKSFRDSMLKLISTFGISESEIVIFLREDRNADRREYELAA